MAWLWVPPSGLLIKDWGEQHCVVFAPDTNATHLVTAEAAHWLLKASQTGGLPADALDEELCAPLVNVGLLRRAESE